MRKLHSIGLMLIAFMAFSCQDKQAAGPQAGAAAPFPVIEVPQRTITGFTSYPVSIEGTVSSAVRAKVPGYITRVLVDEGEKVSKGQILFRLETESLSQEAGAAKANVNAAQVEVDKLKPLVEKGIISPVQLETAKARLEQAKAGYSSIAASIGYATIKSPVDGYVGAINFREGALVSPGDPTPLTTVSDIDEVYAFFSMNERDYLNFIQNAEGESLSEKIENFPAVQLQLVNDRIYSETGEIQTVTGQIDPSTGTVSFRAMFPNPNGILASGNSGKIRIPRTYENVPVVPESASFEQQGIVYVYAVQGDSLATSAPIEVIDRVQNLIVVGEGVKPGDKIVAQGVGKLRNNTPIIPQPVSFDSIATSIKPIFK
ncbi:efflux RND transporter periplasmic adaptor subunit [Salinimicrobium tongyeongense]|jgi:membrane fusion protein (multidrug efflux system)|uniref:Efflux RND transporter periplasmic adaptor subunit n=1 Tax=Salinimicrobium tongyeongense TaxID=2809707 RepID=A0ABY6NM61_9FLAO|nr:efflux RND transporter periplasmic adaptor subunit [Salinimicrobium tongyeongense]UZH53969.1 efflux RND transporter periplasmic adaptor subunit [Salinimicrobium tongyeongense]